MIYCFDLDGTICTMTHNNKYDQAKPIDLMVTAINELYLQGHTIKIFTARGASSGIDWTDMTKNQLHTWKLQYHELIMNKKPSYDIYIDDKAYNVEFWKSNLMYKKRGVIAGNFDIMHPGYIHMFKEAKTVCNHLTILLHIDPSTERSNKLKPILDKEDRTNILLAIKYIDVVITYSTEKDLENILKNYNFDIRIIGDDYINKDYTGKSNCRETYFVQRNHGWSTTKFKNLIKESIIT